MSPTGAQSGGVADSCRDASLDGAALRPDPVLDRMPLAPYAHQRAMFERLENAPAYALFSDMGTGKSQVIIADALRATLSGAIDAVLVVAPKGVYRNWTREEIPKHWPSDVPARVVHWTPAGTKTERDALAAALEPWSGGCVWLAMNVEAFSTPKGCRYAEAFLKAHRAMMVIDESSTVKRGSAKRTRAVVNLGRAAVLRRILTGTPVTQSPLDLYAPCEFLDPKLLGFKSYYAFRARYAELERKHFHGRHITVVKSYRNLPELSAKLDRFSTRVTKEECLDLPPKVYTRREVEMSRDQARAYVEMRTLACTELEGQTVTASIVLAKLVRLHQIVTGALRAAPFDTVPRLDALLDVLDESSGKAIIWATYRADVKAIAGALLERFGRDCCSAYFGDTPAADRPEIVRAFQSDDGHRFFVGSPSTGGYGLTLTAASTVVYYSNSFKYAERIQSEDRCHRIGQTKSVTYVDLVTPGTIDERILESLREKKSLASQVLGEQWKEWV